MVIVQRGKPGHCGCFGYPPESDTSNAAKPKMKASSPEHAVRGPASTQNDTPNQQGGCGRPDRALDRPSSPMSSCARPRPVFASSRTGPSRSASTATSPWPIIVRRIGATRWRRQWPSTWPENGWSTRTACSRSASSCPSRRNSASRRTQTTFRCRAGTGRATRRRGARRRSTQRAGSRRRRLQAAAIRADAHQDAFAEGNRRSRSRNSAFRHGR